jgi:hypothetical protein
MAAHCTSCFRKLFYSLAWEQTCLENPIKLNAILKSNFNDHVDDKFNTKMQIPGQLHFFHEVKKCLTVEEGGFV